MIRLACSQLLHRPGAGALSVSAAVALGLLAEPSVLFALACPLYVVAALGAGSRTGELAALSCLGWSERSVVRLVLIEAGLYGAFAGLLAGRLAGLLAATAVSAGSSGSAGAAGAAVAGSGLAGCVAALLPLAAGTARAVRVLIELRAGSAVLSSGERFR